jgi:hypothetical protein
MFNLIERLFKLYIFPQLVIDVMTIWHCFKKESHVALLKDKFSFNNFHTVNVKIMKFLKILIYYFSLKLTHFQHNSMFDKKSIFN